MKSEWRVMNNPVMGDTPYVAYRLYDVQEVMHSGNVETDYLWFAHKQEALARAAELNEVEQQKSTDGTPIPNSAKPKNTHTV